jgi:hypothetical protein
VSVTQPCNKMCSTCKLINQADKRQVDFASMFLSSQRAYKIEEGKSTIMRAGVKRANVWYGPYTIRAANVSTVIQQIPQALTDNFHCAEHREDR